MRNWREMKLKKGSLMTGEIDVDDVARRLCG